MITFESLDGLWVEFIYEGHWVKVKVTGAKKVENSYSRNVKLRSAITPILSNIELWCLHAVWGFRVQWFKWCDRHLCHVIGSDWPRVTKCTHSLLVSLRLEGSLVVTSSTLFIAAVPFTDADVAKSLLISISNDIGQIAYLTAKLHQLPRIYFGGYFIRGHPMTMHTITYAINYWSQVSCLDCT